MAKFECDGDRLGIRSENGRLTLVEGRPRSADLTGVFGITFLRSEVFTKGQLER